MLLGWAAEACADEPLSDLVTSVVLEPLGMSATGYLPKAPLRKIAARQTDLGGEPRVLGWRVRPDAWGSWPADTMWHTGFTGTSLLIAPTFDLAMILRTNAVHPVRRLADTLAMRSSIHQAVRAVVQ